MKRLLLIFLLVLDFAAQARVSLLTAMPGEDIYQLEGHSGLRIVDESTGRDITVNWGIFDFDSPNFVYRFVSGQTDYLCCAYPTEKFFETYRREGRAVVEQTLDLDSIEQARLQQLVYLNLLPENRTYRYNYVKDNCATRPLEIVERAIGKKLLSDAEAQTTFRSEMKRYHDLYPWYQFGIDLALGGGIDRPITEREKAFAPVELMAQLADNPLVVETRTYGRQTVEFKPTPRYLTPMAVGVLVLLLALTAAFWRGWRVFASVYFSVAFLAGLLLTFLVFISTHEATSPNVLLLWLNPFCLLGAILPWMRKDRLYFAVNIVAVIALLIAAPICGQVLNPAFYPLIAADLAVSARALKR